MGGKIPVCHGAIKDQDNVMNTMLTCTGFVPRVGFNTEDSAFIGRIAGINDIIGFHASRRSS
ncbi:hypothetical protein [Methylobacterium sp. 17Sr1-1]|uniref:hypothetical protein n=1 Tax=Methylobacterium sp. 17Sr1-1 TaxID=2202826 RepID=UPI0013A54E3C|nr:hypothetical protein [Methylobacterium sp. 17Sr1-1]